MTTATKNAPVAGKSDEGNDPNTKQGEQIMDDATSLPPAADTARWTSVHVEHDGILADEYGPLITISNGSDTISVPASECFALIDDLTAALALATGARSLRRPASVDEHLARIDDGGAL